MKFTVNDIEYEVAEKNGKRTNYCYKTENGKKTRISRSVFDEAEVEYIEQSSTKVNEEETTNAITETVNNLKPAKKSKKRKSKDIAHEFEGVTLTAKQVDFIKHLQDTCFWENGLGSCIWVDCLCDEIGGQFKDKPMTVGAMISTLCEKGLGVRCRQKVNGRTATSFELTELGQKIAAELGVE